MPRKSEKLYIVQVNLSTEAATEGPYWTTHQTITDSGGFPAVFFYKRDAQYLCKYLDHESRIVEIVLSKTV